MPQDIRIASVWYRPSTRTRRIPDYFIHETEDWLVLPYELSGLSLEEIAAHKPEMAELVDAVRPLLAVRDKASD